MKAQMKNEKNEKEKLTIVFLKKKNSSRFPFYLVLPLLSFFFLNFKFEPLLEPTHYAIIHIKCAPNLRYLDT